MILAHCLKCEFHERVEIDHKLYSKCNKENCLSIYSNCVRVTAVNKFVSENDLDNVKDQSSALEICYPLAQLTFQAMVPLVPPTTLHPLKLPFSRTSPLFMEDQPRLAKMNLLYIGMKQNCRNELPPLWKVESYQCHEIKRPGSIWLSS